MYIARPDRPAAINTSTNSTPSYRNARHDIVLAMMAWVEMARPLTISLRPNRRTLRSPSRLCSNVLFATIYIRQSITVRVTRTTWQAGNARCPTRGQNRSFQRRSSSPTGLSQREDLWWEIKFQLNDWCGMPMGDAKRKVFTIHCDAMCMHEFALNFALVNYIVLDDTK
jgi:hypothetical protein